MAPAPEPRIEALGDHEYLVHISMDDDIVTVRVRATPQVVADIAGDGADDTAVVLATIAYLTARQRADDLPQELDLDDVIAAYDDYVDKLRDTLRNRPD
ncbi:hypothetical protein MMAG44476_11479 [Mycolicibacterium mageritense DSM 44476 = CIP 104973]|uniref:Uncharacterized protein n=1 Tax=Mycolicibacterium mageritense TaxID=53462 RepID=A0AAI8TX28_MYCME|nr:hypothetical protein [Mycolicibacterium mageritense]MBN3453161.1 hypothetical protein [Mycobacterium sp. DSM 3803]OKH83936.1 hypothetical protein EB73_39360 [Mycobacterium sp. SWH-M3]MCC9180357.1 hypothetical protein [Mycolicibacterium mageritense]TXI52949.1 MAG: hypothetical protein E6Q55_36070 [Mycolicibacterium mageritense]CDO19824.1 hypothetical protein BN978_00275 [Mycolicibacterium mageritense DSM 44476 = CIP 104973]